jgi:hypothetical protein
MNESLGSGLGQSAYICRSITAVLIMSDETAERGTAMGGWSALWLRALPALGATIILTLVIVQGTLPTAAVGIGQQHAVVDVRHLSSRPLAGIRQIPDRIVFHLFSEHRRVEGAPRPAAATPEPSVGQVRP